MTISTFLGLLWLVATGCGWSLGRLVGSAWLVGRLVRWLTSIASGDYGRASAGIHPRAGAGLALPREAWQGAAGRCAAATGRHAWRCVRLGEGKKMVGVISDGEGYCQLDDALQLERLIEHNDGWF